jgi:sporulation protein YlmC with PRC-barrel domain
MKMKIIMKKLGGAILGLALIGLPLTADASVAGRENLVKSRTLMGSPVKSTDGKDLGKVRELLINPEGGEIDYAVVGMGGILGLGEQLIAIPWSDLKVKRDKDKVVFTADRGVFEKAPWFEEGQGRRHPRTGGVRQ